jgi:octanoyl-[GcvH]:protein N-octanoyltransferase
MGALPAVELLRGSIGDDPALEVAVAYALLLEAARGERGPAVRVYRPNSPTVAFGRRDTLRPGFDAAARAARARGYVPVVRAPGGHAASYAGGCLILDEVWPAHDSIEGIHERFSADATRMADALRGVGVDARVGEVRGEYCPGAFTVNARGAVKLIGAAQRVVRGAWLLSTVVVVDGADQLRAVLEDVYAALELDWDPSTFGSIAGEQPGTTIEAVERALLDGYAARYQLVPTDVSAATRAAALELIDRHRVVPSPA